VTYSPQPRHLAASAKRMGEGGESTVTILLKLTDLVRDVSWRKGKAVFLADTCCV